MAKEGLIKLVHLPLLALTFVASIITLGISAGLVSDWNSHGYPNTSLRDRSRICLTASILTCVFTLYFGIGCIFAASSVAFGIFAHLIAFLAAFILFLCGAASITASVSGVDCGNVDWSHCNLTKGLEVMSWITTIFVFVALLFVLGLGIKARSGSGMRRGTLVAA